MKFKLLSGNYTVKKEKFKQGSIVISDLPLDKIFANKFLRLTDKNGEIVVDKNQAKRRLDSISEKNPSSRKNQYRLGVLKRGWYDVISVDTGKAVNSRNLREPAALDLVKSLGGVVVEAPVEVVEEEE